MHIMKLRLIKSQAEPRKNLCWLYVKMYSHLYSYAYISFWQRKTYYLKQCLFCLYINPPPTQQGNSAQGLHKCHIMRLIPE